MRAFIIILSSALLATYTLSNCKKEMGTMACMSIPATGTTGSAVNFSSSCSMEATDFKWEFGDGDTSIAANPTHIYTAAATYTVKLTAIKGSKMDKTSKSIKIQ